MLQTLGMIRLHGAYKTSCLGSEKCLVFKSKYYALQLISHSVFPKPFLLFKTWEF